MDKPQDKGGRVTKHEVFGADSCWAVSAGVVLPTFVGLLKAAARHALGLIMEVRSVA